MSEPAPPDAPRGRDAELARIGSLLDALADGAAPGWRAVSGAVSAAWRPEPDRATAWIDVTVPATPEAVAAIVQDPRGTGLAGELLAFTSAERSPEQRHTRYAVAMPWPLRPRRFAITSTRHPCTGGLWLLNRSNPEDAAPWSVDGVDGVLYCSDYRLRAVSGGCRIERLLSIDLKLPMPARWTGKLLGAEMRADAQRFARAVAAAG